MTAIAKVEKRVQFEENGKYYLLIASAKLEKLSGNKHAYFSITADLKESANTVKYYKQYGNVISWREYSGGCLHDEVEKHVPEWKKYLKWHLTDATGIPMYYIENTLYHASNLDCWGKYKGEPKSPETKIYFNDVPIPYGEKLSQKFIAFIQERNDWENLAITSIAHRTDQKTFHPYWTFVGYGTEWHHCPFHSEEEITNFKLALTTCKVEFKTVFTSFGEGKERDFDAARNYAVWPEATEEQLSLPKEELKSLLLERLPKLQEEFFADMIELFGDNVQLERNVKE